VIAYLFCAARVARGDHLRGNLHPGLHYLPPGDFVDAYIADLAASGSATSQDRANATRHEFGLDRPVVVQCWLWTERVVHGDSAYL
jgi:ABC-type dipeptide/oligopeptide/nickel transport system permease component